MGEREGRGWFMRGLVSYATAAWQACMDWLGGSGWWGSFQAGWMRLVALRRAAIVAAQAGLLSSWLRGWLKGSARTGPE